MKNILFMMLFLAAPKPVLAEKVCTAIRGNGFHIGAHLGSLARITEDVGPVESLSTSSSGASSAFLYESIFQNQLIKDADSNTCVTEECREKVSFLLKSLPVYLSAFHDSKTIGRDVRGFVDQIKFLQKLAGSSDSAEKENVEQKKIEKEESKEVSNAVFLVMALLFQHDDIRSLIRPSYYQRIGIDPVKERLDLWSMDFGEAKFMLNFLFNYKFPDFRVFVRDGLINFEFLIELIGVMADYLSAYNPQTQKEMEYIFAHCAKDSKGLLWDEIKTRNVNGKSCETLLRESMIAHIDSYATSKKSIRLSEKVGARIDSFVTTSMVSGKEKVEQFIYHRNHRTSDPFFISLDESNLKVGVYGNYKSLFEGGKSKNGETDSLHQKTIVLPNRTWRHALVRSLSEPGASALKLELTKDGNSYVTLGGWIDHNTSIYLKNNSCDNVVWITKKASSYTLVKPLVDLVVGRNSNFLTKTYDPRSALGVEQNRRRLTDAVVCNDWDRYTELEYWGLIKEGYTAPIFTEKASLYNKFSGKNIKLEPINKCFDGEKLPDSESLSLKI